MLRLTGDNCGKLEPFSLNDRAVLGIWVAKEGKKLEERCTYEVYTPVGVKPFSSVLYVLGACVCNMLWRQSGNTQVKLT